MYISVVPVNMYSCHNPNMHGFYDQVSHTNLYPLDKVGLVKPYWEIICISSSVLGSGVGDGIIT